MVVPPPEDDVLLEPVSDEVPSEVDAVVAVGEVVSLDVPLTTAVTEGDVLDCCVPVEEDVPVVAGSSSSAGPAAPPVEEDAVELLAADEEDAAAASRS